MTFTSINISNNEYKFKYIIEYKNYTKTIVNNYRYDISGEDIIFSNNNELMIKNNNIYINHTVNKFTDDFMPKNIRLSSIDLYFPEYSLDVYENNVNYALTINTWINNKYICLGTHIFSTIDAISSEKVRTFFNQKYYEKINIKFIDPYSIIYDDEWKEWRYRLCDSKKYNDIELNNNGAILNFTLHPIRKDSDNTYISLENFIGGQNAMNLLEKNNINLKYNLSFRNNMSPTVDFLGYIEYNNVYEKNIDGFKEYLMETYDIHNPKITYEFFIQDNNDVYDYFLFEKDDIKCKLSKTDLNRKYPESHKYTSWNDFVEGMYINSLLNICDENGEVIITVKSNDIAITQDVFKYLIFAHENSLDFIKLNMIDMNIYDLNIVNKIQKNIIQLDRPKDYKSNLIKPVYYKTRELSNLVIHPDITENICLNLDGYKYLVDSFIIRIEGVNFIESARTPNGVIFKIIGNKLPNKQTSGSYYILNQDSELITTGKYLYEI